MAVEIRELIIKAIIVDDKNNSSEDGMEQESSLDQSKVIQECVNQVLKILKKGKNR